jgi:hypothetical protein
MYQMHESTDSIHLIGMGKLGIFAPIANGQPLKKVGDWGKSAKSLNGEAGFEPGPFKLTRKWDSQLFRP